MPSQTWIQPFSFFDIASTQFEDGSAYHQYQLLTRQGNADIGSGFNDDPLWLIAAVAAYIKETGDYEILDEPVPFDCKKGTEEPLFEHLNRSFQFTVTHLGQTSTDRKGGLE